MSKLCATWKRRCNQIWNELYLWRDIDANGMSTVSEMLRPGALGIASFETIAKFRKYFDAAGNIIPYWGWAKGRTRPKNTLMVDVYFLVLDSSVAVCNRSPRSVKAS